MCINGHKKNLSKPHCINMATTFGSAATNSLIASCSLSLHWTYILPTQQGKGGSVLPFSLLFHHKRGVHAGCRGNSRVYTRENFTLPECTSDLSRDSPCVPRADLFKVDAHPKNKLNNKIEVLNN
jgi:hypothetical protein